MISVADSSARETTGGFSDGPMIGAVRLGANASVGAAESDGGLADRDAVFARSAVSLRKCRGRSTSVD